MFWPVSRIHMSAYPGVTVPPVLSVRTGANHSFMTWVGLITLKR
jgi:hypothetical protein